MIAVLLTPRPTYQPDGGLLLAGIVALIVAGAYASSRRSSFAFGKTMRLLLSFLAIVSCLVSRADDGAILAEVRSADDARVAAMISADGKQLDEMLSDSLHYAHSADNFVEDKAQHIASLVNRRGIYQRFDFKTRDFSVVAPGAVVCKGRALVDVGGSRMIFRVDINFLAVWRLEGRRWRLFAWQSSRNADIVPLGPPAETGTPLEREAK